MTRDIAISFNHTYGKKFCITKQKLMKWLATVPGTDGAKMSKSYNNTIDMFGPAKTIKNKL